MILLHTPTVDLTGMVVFALLLGFLGVVFGFILRDSIGDRKNGNESDTKKES